MRRQAQCKSRNEGALVQTNQRGAWRLLEIGGSTRSFFFHLLKHTCIYKGKNLQTAKFKKSNRTKPAKFETEVCKPIGKNLEGCKPIGERLIEMTKPLANHQKRKKLLSNQRTAEKHGDQIMLNCSACQISAQDMRLSFLRGMGV